MFDLDKMISEAYGEESMSFESIAKMVEKMLVLQESLGNLSEQNISISNNAPQNLPTTGDIPTPQKINPMVVKRNQGNNYEIHLYLCSSETNARIRSCDSYWGASYWK